MLKNPINNIKITKNGNKTRKKRSKKAGISCHSSFGIQLFSPRFRQGTLQPVWTTQCNTHRHLHVINDFHWISALQRHFCLLEFDWWRRFNNSASALCAQVRYLWFKGKNRRKSLPFIIQDEHNCYYDLLRNNNYQ